MLMLRTYGARHRCRHRPHPDTCCLVFNWLQCTRPGNNPFGCESPLNVSIECIEVFRARHTPSGIAGARLLGGRQLRLPTLSNAYTPLDAARNSRDQVAEPPKLNSWTSRRVAERQCCGHTRNASRCRRQLQLAPQSAPLQRDLLGGRVVLGPSGPRTGLTHGEMIACQDDAWRARVMARQPQFLRRPACSCIESCASRCRHGEACVHQPGLVALGAAGRALLPRCPSSI